MATDPYLLDRIRNALKGRSVEWTEKRMFGGNCLLVDDKMLMGTYQGKIMARVNPEQVEELSKNEFAEEMIHGGRKMTGFMMIAPEGFDMEDDLEFWVEKCLDYNPLAKSSKKKK